MGKIVLESAQFQTPLEAVEHPGACFLNICRRPRSLRVARWPRRRALRPLRGRRSSVHCCVRKLLRSLRKSKKERPPRDKGSFQRGAESRKTLRTLLMMSSRRLSRSTSTNGSILKVRCSSFNVRSFCVTSKSTNMSVSDMKGKFIKPTLKKVSKYENKFAKLQEKAAKFAFANQLKAKDK